MPYRHVVAGVLAAALMLGACGEVDGEEPRADGPAGDAGQIDVELIAGISPEEVTDVAASVNAFGFDLHRALAADGGNVVTSPLSVSVLLAMVAAGADGVTADEMAAVLHLDDARDDRFGALLLEVADTDDVAITVANALWANAGTPLEEAYADHVRGVFGATLDEVPLGEQDAADAIDAWVQDRTAGLIDGIAEDLGLPNPLVVLVLVNAVHFQGDWTVRFDEAHTAERDFTLADGNVVTVPTMHRYPQGDDQVEVAVRDGYQVLRLTYGDDARYGMEILLPDRDADLPTLLDRLDAAEWEAAVTALTPTQVDVALPRFELEWDADLTDHLADLGMPSAFGDGADFRPMSPADPFLGSVVHKTVIRVDERGTEAAAVTGGDMPTAAPPSPFIVDRPFAFTVSDAQTGTVLFLGTVEDPRG